MADGPPAGTRRHGARSGTSPLKVDGAGTAQGRRSDPQRKTPRKPASCPLRVRQQGTNPGSHSCDRRIACAAELTNGALPDNSQDSATDSGEGGHAIERDQMMFEWFQTARQPRGDDGARIEIEYRARDCHCHVIPGVDDGSRSLSESLEMLKLLRFDGAQTVIATPHIFPGRFPNEADDLKRRFEMLCEAAAGIATLELGAEYYLDETFPARIEGPLLSFGRERYVLFEAHTGAQAPVDLLRVVYRLL